MDLKQLQYFVVCAQTGSFSDAAKVLYSTQPSVSKVVKALEDALGMQLFERLPRGIRLTVQGQKVYRYACRITNEISVLENMASHGMTKWIRVSLNPSSWFANHDAVNYDNGKAFVYCYDNGAAKKVMIEAGIYDAQTMEVKSGLTAGDQVITTWSNELVDGQEVLIDSDNGQNENAAQGESAAENAGEETQKAGE